MDIKAFRKAVTKGKGQIALNRKNVPLDVEFTLTDATGKDNILSISAFIRKMNGRDYEDFHAIQFDASENEDDKKVCSSYAAATIVGLVDAEGERIFTEDDIDFLDSSENIKTCMMITAEVFKKSEITEDIRSAKKPK